MSNPNLTRVTFRIETQKLERWDAVCTDEDSLDESDSEEFRELVKELPHLYRNRSELIRESVETQIFSEQQDDTIRLEQIENQISSLNSDIDSIQNTLSTFQDSIQYISSNIEEDTTDLQSDIYKLIPIMESWTQFMRKVKNVDFNENQDAEEYGRIQDIKDYFHDQPDRKVSKAIEELIIRVDDVQKHEFETDNKNKDEFLVREVDNE